MFLTVIEYWIEHLQNNLPLLQRFTKQFVSEGLSIILKFNYFYINKSFFHQIKRTAMRTKFAFLDIQLKIVNNTIIFDIYYKPTNSFNYLTYSSCHPSHNKNNIALSLAKRIINVVTDNRETRLSELKKHLIERNHPPEIIDCTFSKCFQPKQDKNKDFEKLIFTRTFNPSHVIDYK